MSPQKKIPDGGWGWVIVFCSFLITLICDGIAFSFGLIYISLVEEFSGSRAAIAWIGSLFLAAPLLAGPICSTLVHLYGCRRMTITGGIMSCVGFLCSSFSSSVIAMYFSLGIMAGLSLGLCYVTAVVSVAYWFDKKRTLANSLGAMGTGLGTSFFAPFTRFAIAYYGWRGTLMLLGGVLLHLCICGSLMRDPDWLIKQNTTSSGSSLVREATEVESFIQDENERKMKNETDKQEPAVNFRSLVDLPTYVDSEEVKNHNTKTASLLDVTTISETVANVQVLSGGGHRYSLMYRGFLLNMMNKSCPDLSANAVSENPEKPPKYKCYSGCSAQAKNAIFTALDPSIIGDFHFMMMSVATVLLCIWFIIPYFYIAGLMTECGQTKNAASLVLFVIGLASTCGLVVMGWAGDRPWMNVTKCYAVCLVISGLSTVAMPLVSSNVIYLIAVSFTFGFFIASCYSFTPTILVELADLERFTTSYGISLLCQGMGTLIGPPVGGWIYDYTESWTLIFYFAGGGIMAGGLLIAVIPVTKSVQLWGPRLRRCQVT